MGHLSGFDRLAEKNHFDSICYDLKFPSEVREKIPDKDKWLGILVEKLKLVNENDNCIDERIATRSVTQHVLCTLIS